MKRYFPLILICLVSFSSHFALLSYPAQAVFDEVYFGTFANAYFTHQYYFDIHPPLGKMLIAGFAKLAGMPPGFALDQIGQAFASQYLFILRFLPALFGSLLPVIIYLILKKAGTSTKTAFLGAALVILDNALLVQSKFILLDSILLCFGFGAILALLYYKDTPAGNEKYLLLGASVFLATLAFSIKWTGLTFFAIILVVAATQLARQFNVKQILVSIALVLAVPFLTYTAVFYVHFNLLQKSGPGDAYMSPEFQGSLENNALHGSIPAIGTWEKFVQLNKAMYFYNTTLSAGHPYGSKWYQWPLGQKPIWYWTQTQPGGNANIYLAANPVVWGLALAGATMALLAFFIRKTRKAMPALAWMCLGGFVINLLAYVFIGRVAFLYHYLPSLIFGIILFSLVYEKIIMPAIATDSGKKMEPALYGIILTLSLIAFVLIAPVTYGWALPQDGWLNSLYQATFL